MEVAYGLSIGTDLDDLKRRNSPYFAYFSPNSIALQADKCYSGRR